MLHSSIWNLSVVNVKQSQQAYLLEAISTGVDNRSSADFLVNLPVLVILEDDHMDYKKGKILK